MNKYAIRRCAQAAGVTSRRASHMSEAFLHMVHVSCSIFALTAGLAFAESVAPTNDPVKEAELRAERATKDAKALAIRMADPVLLARGEPFVHSDRYLDAINMPVGGIGAGMIQMNGRAEMAIWQIFNNNTSFKVPDSFLAVRVKDRAGKPFVKALQTLAVGPFDAMKSLSFRGAYPFGQYVFNDPDLPVKLSLETFSPLIPMDEKNSGMPCAVFNVTVENPSDKSVEVSLLACQQNAVGYRANQEIDNRKHSAYGSNSIVVIRDPAATLLHMTRNAPQDAAVQGDMVLMAMAEKVTVSADWAGLTNLCTMFEAASALPGPDKGGPSTAGETVNGALAVTLNIAAGQKQTVSFVLVWHFPGGVGQWSGGGGNMYVNWWSDALSLARELQKTLPELTRRTRLYTDTLYASNLPYWLLDRIGSQVAVLRSRTCFWTKDGYFGGWEGCNPKKGCCKGNCNHVWHYAQTHARLFPGIARRMREQEFRFQRPDGGIPYRQPGEFPVCDGQSGAVLNSYREHLMSPDGKWLDKNWAGITNAMNYSITTWDKDEDGVLAGPQWNTLDGALGGSTSWLGSLYLAALAAAEKMAILEKDGDAAKRYGRIFASGAKTQDETLFNGEHYIQIPDETPQQDYGNGCHIDQVLGQWWANQLDLGPIYPADHVRTALAMLLKSNFRTDFKGVAQMPRKFVTDSDSGLQMITWPKGTTGKKEMQYASEVMSGFEYSAAAAMIQSGLLREGLTVARSTWERYDGRLREGLSGGNFTSWGFSGNPFGDDECGKFYARSLSSWSLLLACQGYVYDGPAGVIGFRPVWQPENHSSMFTAAEGWGLFTQLRADKKQTEQIKVVEGRVRITALVFRLPKDCVAKSVELRLAGAVIVAKPVKTDADLRLTLDQPIVVESGSVLEVTIKL
ncbi:MAG: GH116 family glycosyl-hydrolase [bacterium]